MSCLVVIEPDATGISEVSTETITFARSLGTDIDALVIGNGDVEKALLPALGEYGVSRVFAVSGDGFDTYAPAAWGAATVAAAEA
ncbi:MAG: hypothetical protein WA880_00015, partial [Ornithinimicrobium sp.]